MVNFMILFAITVLVAAYSGIMFFTGKIKENARLKKSHYGVLCVVFIILAVIELIVYNVMWQNIKTATIVLSLFLYFKNWNVVSF